MNIQNKMMMINGWHSIIIFSVRTTLHRSSVSTMLTTITLQAIPRPYHSPHSLQHYYRCTVQITTPSSDDPVPTKQVVYKTFSTIKFSITILITETAVGHHPMLFTSRWPAVECDILSHQIHHLVSEQRVHIERDGKKNYKLVTFQREGGILISHQIHHLVSEQCVHIQKDAKKV